MVSCVYYVDGRVTISLVNLTIWLFGIIILLHW